MLTINSYYKIKYYASHPFCPQKKETFRYYKIYRLITSLAFSAIKCRINCTRIPLISKGADPRLTWLQALCFLPPTLSTQHERDMVASNFAGYSYAYILQYISHLFSIRFRKIPPNIPRKSIIVLNCYAVSL